MFHKKTLLFVLLCGISAAQFYAAADDAAVVVAKKFRFDPQEITVKVGTTVRWENHEKRQYHSVWFKELGEEPGEYFFPGETVERTFDEPGTFPYVCEPHEKEGMIGVVHVDE